MSGSITSIDIMKELLNLLLSQWNVEKFGDKPSMNITYDRTVLGTVVGRKQENIVLFADNSGYDPFDIGGSVRNVAWKSEVGATINVYTNVSEHRTCLLYTSPSPRDS